MIRATEAQVAAFRAERSHLASRAVPDSAAVAREVLGAQAQILLPALHAIALRTAAPQRRSASRDKAGTGPSVAPTAESVRAELLDSRALIHTWGQRDTLHLYHPEDWPYIAASWSVWLRTGRRGLEPPKNAVARAAEKLDEGEPLTRTDVANFLPKSYVDEWEERIGNRADAIRFAAGRLFWKLAHDGTVCLGPTRGREQTYVSRSTWLPKLEWKELDPTAAATELTRRYLRVHGPATAGDIAHFFGAKVSSATGWLDALSQLVEVRTGDRKGLFLHESDVDALRRKRPPPRARLLPKFDTLLMAHADKSWTVPNEDERKRVWLRFADVSATVLARGRVVATWKHKATRKRLAITVSPLGEWKSGLRKEVEAEAEATAHILGAATAEVSWEG